MRARGFCKSREWRFLLTLLLDKEKKTLGWQLLVVEKKRQKVIKVCVST